MIVVQALLTDVMITCTKYSRQRPLLPGRHGPAPPISTIQPEAPVMAATTLQKTAYLHPSTVRHLYPPLSRPIYIKESGLLTRKLKISACLFIWSRKNPLETTTSPVIFASWPTLLRASTVSICATERISLRPIFPELLPTVRPIVVILKSTLAIN